MATLDRSALRVIAAGASGSTVVFFEITVLLWTLAQRQTFFPSRWTQAQRLPNESSVAWVVFKTMWCAVVVVVFAAAGVVFKATWFAVVIVLGLVAVSPRSLDMVALLSGADTR